VWKEHYLTYISKLFELMLGHLLTTLLVAYYMPTNAHMHEAYFALCIFPVKIVIMYIVVVSRQQIFLM